MVTPPLRQHHLLMVHFELGTSEHFELPVEKGLTFHVNASYIDAHTGRKLADTRLHLTGPQDLHFIASSKEVFHGWWYLIEYDRKARVYRCSCFEAKSCGFCEHIEMLSPEFVVA